MALLDLFKRPKATKASAIPSGWVVYAVGDIHGRLDLFNMMIEAIRNDHAQCVPRQRGLVVLLGDYIDRGPSSAGVIDAILNFETSTGLVLRPLKGNHEQALMAFLNDPIAGAPWLSHGGIEALASYGVTVPRNPPAADLTEIRNKLAAALPPEHLAFLRSLKTLLVFGDYIFVHAGLRPGRPIEEQTENDLLWIRDDFLRKPWLDDSVVVHGHTPISDVELRSNKIGVDTGAFATGVLTALRLQGSQRDLLQVSVGGPAPAPVDDVEA
jgi:serine/threonine protein phosphatase 1